ncbi:hypothetical protein AA313_de0200488 [Arthrobotrys entomopaga]|nr:hypothetical protein AA313_de0200488 [Arthrobotrys entomopaga]
MLKSTNAGQHNHRVIINSNVQIFHRLICSDSCLPSRRACVPSRLSILIWRGVSDSDDTSQLIRPPFTLNASADDPCDCAQTLCFLFRCWSTDDQLRLLQVVLDRASVLMGCIYSVQEKLHMQWQSCLLASTVAASTVRANWRRMLVSCLPLQVRRRHPPTSFGSVHPFLAMGGNI